MILAGDIGGTKTVLALFAEKDDGVSLLREETYASRAYPSLEAILVTFLEQEPELSLRTCCLGVAGPVLDGQCRSVHLPWTLEELALAHAIGAPYVKLLNDLEAAAYGVLYLQPPELHVLNPGRGRERQGQTVAVIAAGVGLGEAILTWDGVQFRALATEGGHASFAPNTDQEIELLRYLRAKFEGHISFERVLSDSGIYNIYSFLRDSGYGSEPTWLAEKLRSEDPSSIIVHYGLSGADPLCVATLEMFASIYGGEAGNLALNSMALGGVYVGGSLAPSLLPVLQQGGFMQSFTAKGRFAELLQSIEVVVALNPHTTLLGAAHFALRL